MDFAEFMLIFKIGEMYPGPFALDRLVKDHSQKRKMSVDEEVPTAAAGCPNFSVKSCSLFSVFCDEFVIFQKFWIEICAFAHLQDRGDAPGALQDGRGRGGADLAAARCP